MSDSSQTSARSLPRSAVVALVLVSLVASVAVCWWAAGNDGAEDGELSVADAIVLGTVEGVTEYLPVSSTGHLLVTQRLLNLEGETEDDKEASDAYAITIQGGAILAVVVLYRRRLTTMVEGLLGRSDEGKRLVMAIAVAFIPAAVTGLLFQDIITDRLFSPGPIAWAWLIGGLGVLAYVRRSPDTSGTPLELITPRMMIIIGVAQTLALWPGVSRSLVTMMGGLLAGLSLAAAVEFAFLLGLATLLAATAYEALGSGDLIIENYGWGPTIIGFIVAFITAVIAVRWMVSYLQTRSLAIFGWYRIAIALGTFALIGADVI